jgi:PAS domain S-box-containing protein
MKKEIRSLAPAELKSLAAPHGSALAAPPQRRGFLKRSPSGGVPSNGDKPKPATTSEVAIPAGGHPAALPDSPSSHRASELKTNILLVDDRPDKLLAFQAILSSLEQNIVAADSGKEALRLLLKHDFAVILLDVYMPGMDGFETAALIRQCPTSEHTPIIFVTSIDSTENHISRGHSLGAVDYLTTPIIPEVLRTKVSVFVELHRQTELVKRQAELLRSIEQYRHERELAEVSNRLELETRRNRFFTLAVSLVGIADSNGHWLQTNPAWERLLGYKPEELVQHVTTELVHPGDLPAFSEQMRQLKIEPVELELRFRHKNGSWRWLRWTAAPFPAENLLYVFARDVTARKQAEAKGQELTRQLEQRVVALTSANQELESFNYSIAHDLRGPLRSLSGFAEALLEDESSNLTPVGQDYATRVARSARYMDAMLLDMLAYCRLARAEITPTRVSLKEPVHELLCILDNEIRSRRVQIEVASPLGEVWAHLPTLKQVLSNLVSNAVKFTAPERPPRVRIFSTPNGKFVRLWVEDNGIGIAPQHHEKIFGLFQRLHDNNTYPGTGVGLALVRKGAERLGGCAGVESELGQGSRFWVDFPTATPNSDEPSDSAR